MSTESAAGPRIGIFRGVDETVNLAVPFGVSLLIYLLIRCNFWPGDFYVYLVVNVLFFNVTHVALAMFSMSYLPEIRGWLAEHSPREKLALIAETSVVFVFIVGYLFWSAYTPSLRVLGVSLDGWQSCVLMLIATRHFLRQSYGLSQMYSQQMRSQLALTGKERGDWDRAVLLEKRLFAVFELAVLTQAVGLIPGILVHVQALLFWFYVLAAVLVVLMVANAYLLMPGGRRSNKAIFLTRLGIFPLGHLALPFQLGNGSMHGFEYFFVWRLMKSRSTYEPTRASRAVFCLFMVVISALALTVTLGAPITPQALALFGSRRKLIFLNHISGTFSFFHYYCDLKLYRMKSAKSRKWIAPLLAKPAEECAPVAEDAPAYALAADPA